MKNLFLFLLTLLCVTGFAQNDFTQNIKGQITDSETGFPLIGANVVVVDSDPIIGASTDLDGYFMIANLPVGRYSLSVSYLGYAESGASNLLLTSGKEMVVDFALVESIYTGEEVVVTALVEKDAKSSELATISVQEFNAEVAGRYSGSRNDVSRMAAGFAGVVANDDTRNDIVIRGNSPSGLLWRLDGMDVPNPSHFGALGASGGPVSMLNYNMLDNSTFLTGAFPASYGNALSGVFDVKIRKGNKDKFEGTGQISFNGFEAGIEGPFSKNSDASYLVNYRYSVIGLINKIANTGNATGTGEAIPFFEDLSFKVNVPTKKLGTFSLLGLGGKSNITFMSNITDSENPDLFTGSRENLFYKTNMGLIALSNKHYYNNHSYGQINLSMTSSGNQTDQDLVNTDLVAVPFFRDASKIDRGRLAYEYKNKINVRNTFNAGATINRFDFTFKDSVKIDEESEIYRVRRSYEGNTFLHQAFTQWQYRANEKLTLNLGLFGQFFSLNDTYAVEPRFNMKYTLNPSVKFTLGAGRHSRVQDFQLYLVQTPTADGPVETNKDLKMTSSDQVMTGVEWGFAPGWNLKTEAYYQALKNVPIESKVSAYSAINEGADFNVPSVDSLVNDGTGTNYGLEVTLEKAFNKGFYMLSTISLFKSTYVASDGVERSTAFDGGYVANLLIGKEWTLNKRFSIGLDAKVTGAGGRRTTPIDLEASIAQGREVRDRSNIFGEQLPDYFRSDIKFTIRMNGKKISQEWSMDMQNVFDTDNIFSQRYSNTKQEIVRVNQLGRFPVINYKVTF